MCDWEWGPMSKNHQLITDKIRALIGQANFACLTDIASALTLRQWAPVEELETSNFVKLRIVKIKIQKISHQSDSIT